MTFGSRNSDCVNLSSCSEIGTKSFKVFVDFFCLVLLIFKLPSLIDQRIAHGRSLPIPSLHSLLGWASWQSYRCASRRMLPSPRVHPSPWIVLFPVEPSVHRVRQARLEVCRAVQAGCRASRGFLLRSRGRFLLVNHSPYS